MKKILLESSKVSYNSEPVLSPARKLAGMAMLVSAARFSS